MSKAIFRFSESLSNSHKCLCGMFK